MEELGERMGKHRTGQRKGEAWPPNMTGWILCGVECRVNWSELLSPSNYRQRLQNSRRLSFPLQDLYTSQTKARLDKLIGCSAAPDMESWGTRPSPLGFVSSDRKESAAPTTSTGTVHTSAKETLP